MKKFEIFSLRFKKELLMSIAIIFTLVFFGCRINVIVKSYDGIIVANIRNAENIEESNSSYNFKVYASLIIKNTTDEILQFNLKDIHLNINGNNSAGTYVNSIATMVEDFSPIKLKQGDEKKLDIYWVFPNRFEKSKLSDLNLQLIYEKKDH